LRRFWLAGVFLASAAVLAAQPVITEFPGSSPTRVVAGPDGAVWFLGLITSTFKVGRITPSQGTQLYTVPNASGVMTLSGIALGPDGALWVTETLDNKVGRMTTKGVVTGQYTVNLPNLIVTGPDGALWVTESAGNKIARVSTAGAVVEYPVATTILGITAGPDGALWFTEGTSKIARMNTAGTVAAEYSVAGLANEITAGPDGALWFTMTTADKIGRIATNGQLTYFPTPHNSKPTGITVGPDGAIWYAEPGSNRIARITTDGVTVNEYLVPTAGGQPQFITYGPDGALWFSEAGGAHGAIGRAVLSAALAPTFTDTLAAANAGLFDLTVGPDGAVWFIDEANNKVDRIKTDGSLSLSQFPFNVGAGGGRIAAGPDGALWITTISNSTITRMSTNGTVTNVYPMPGAAPSGIVAGPDGALWIAEVSKSKIARMTTGGVITNEYPLLTPGNYPQDIVVGRDGALWFTETPFATIGSITTTGSMQEFPLIQPNVFLDRLCSGPDGAVWFTESFNNKIGKINTIGDIWEYQVPTANAGALRITAGPDGALWFTESSGSKIGRIALDGTFEEYPRTNSQPHSIVAGPDGAIWFLDQGRIVRAGLPPPQPVVTEFPVPSEFIPAMTVGPDGALWYTDEFAGKIGRITPAGAVSEFTVSSWARDITVGPDGALWFAEPSIGKMGRITTSGAVTEYPLPAGAAPIAIATGTDGALWFADGGLNAIGRITTSGAVTEYPIPTANAGAWGIALGPDGALWFTELLVAKIGRITTAGAITEFVVPFPGSAPVHIALGPDGALWYNNSNRSTVGRITAAAAFTEYPIPQVTGGGLAFGPDGALWLPEENTYGVVRVTTSGASHEYPPELELVFAALDGPVAAGPDGAIWFAERNKMGRVALPTSLITSNVAIVSSPPGVNVTVDGPADTTPALFRFPLGSIHAIGAQALQQRPGGIQNGFLNWSDGQPRNRWIDLPPVPAIYAGNFSTQYLLTALAAPPAGGSVVATPPTIDGYYDPAASVQVTANHNAGYAFSSWTGNVANPAGATTTVTMTGPQTVTANFTALTSVTIVTNPAGLAFTVDNGVAQIAPQTIGLLPGAHTISVKTVLHGEVGTQYQFLGWSDHGSPTHPINVGASPATYTADFQTQYQLTISASPAAEGLVTPAGAFLNAGTVVNISATANSGYQFTGWSGPVADAAAASTTATMTGPLTLTANFGSLTGITIQTNPPGLQFSLDGTLQTAPQSLNLSSGQHTIAVANTQAGSPGTQYVYSSWSDGGGISHPITVGNSAATYTANFTTQYQLSLAASPAAGGLVSPAGGFINSGTVVNVSATANSGYQFTGWTGPVANPGVAGTTVTMTAPAALIASFGALTTIQTSPTGLQFIVDDGALQTAPQSLSLSPGPHTVVVPLLQTGPPGTRYIFSSWSDAGGISHPITVGSSPATYTAIFTTQYQLNLAASPAAGGTVTPPGGQYYDAGSGVQITATPNPGYGFTGWSGAAIGNPGAASTIIAINGPTSLTASFAPSGFTLSAPSAGFGGSGGTGTVGVVTNPAGAAWTAASNAAWIAITSGAQGAGDGSVGYSVAANPSATPRSGTLTIAGQTFTVNQGGTGLLFVPVTPCRVMDTRLGSGKSGAFGAPSIGGGSSRDVPIPQSTCGIPPTAQAYSLNVTVVPPGPLTYLTMWPSGQAQPLVSTLNSFDGRVVANAALVPAGSSGAVSVFVSDASDVILDINGYFVPPGGAGLAFYPVTPCRIADTRGSGLTGVFGTPAMDASSTRTFPIPTSSCNIPAGAQAYSLNVTVVPHGPLGYLTTWPAGQAQPFVSTLNSFDGSVVANAAIVPAGSGGGIAVFVTDATEVILDLNGYFAAPGGLGALSFYPVNPCRVVDTRPNQGTSGAFGPPAMVGDAARSFPVPTSACGIPAGAQAYAMNATVVPPAPLIYLTAWPAGLPQPTVSTLNSFQGKVVANAAIVPGGGGAISVYVSDPTELILDINGYFAQ